MKCSVKFNWKVLLILPPVSNILQRVWDMIHPMEDHELRADLDAPERRELITEWVQERMQLKDQSQHPSGLRSQISWKPINLKGAMLDHELYRETSDLDKQRTPYVSFVQGPRASQLTAIQTDSTLS